MGEPPRARPLSVTVPAIGAVVVGVLGWLVALSLFVVGMNFIAAAGWADVRGGFPVEAGLLVGFTIWGATMVYAGLHTLRGDRTARLLLVGVFGLSALPGLALMPILPLFLLACAYIAGIVALLHPESRAWFAPSPVKSSPE